EGPHPTEEAHADAEQHGGDCTQGETNRDPRDAGLEVLEQFTRCNQIRERADDRAGGWEEALVKHPGLDQYLPQNEQQHRREDRENALLVLLTQAKRRPLPYGCRSIRGGVHHALSADQALYIRRADALLAHRPPSSRI